MLKPNYFQISISHYNSVEALSVRQKYQWAGYGLYLAIMQILANAPDRILPLSKLSQLAYELRISEEVLTDIVRSYFEIVDDYFYSQELENGVSAYIKKVSTLNPSNGGKASAASMTAEERIERSKKALAAKASKRLAKSIVPDSNGLDSSVEKSIVVDSIVKDSIVPSQQADSNSISKQVLTVPASNLQKQLTDSASKDFNSDVIEFD
jgi:hypothetical protein